LTGWWKPLKSSDRVISKNLPDKRLRLNFSGTVQGVGFRPHIFRVATSRKLSGFVCNLQNGVLVEIEGPENALTNFINEIKSSLPVAARIEEIKSKEIPVVRNPDAQQKKFTIIESLTSGPPQMSIGADTATCPACIKEMQDPTDRRCNYPFINCTDCGPRLTIVRDIPYDRQRTSMAEFPLCRKCKKEYDNPESRRFHAEATACPECGPQLSFFAPANHLLATGTEKPLNLTKKFLQQGKIIAIKGLGGFHLAVDAGNHEAVQLLRQRKQRDGKPFALMVRNLQAATTLAHINDQEKELLASPARPILLLRKKETGNLISPAVAKNLAVFGIMLPYTPLHHLLLHTIDSIALVMTSANLHSEPIVIDNREAQVKLAGIADYFLCHNRDIVIRLDDSIAFVSGQKTQVVRRSRGYVPQTLTLNIIKTEPVLALGGHLKSSLCLVQDKKALFSPHIGDLDNPQARNFFQENIALIEKIGVCKPDIIACDLHPDYYSSITAEKMTGKTIIRVQHHHAHIVSCMADNQLSGKVLGIALDGTGLGVDGKIWGGEFLCADSTDFIRAGQIAYFPLPGGEKALLEPWRCALSLLKLCDPENWLETARRLHCTPESFSDTQLDLLLKQTVNRPLTSSMGRLFDAVAAILGFSGEITYEGQAAIELEALTTKEPAEGYRKNLATPDILPWEIIKTNPPQSGAAHYQLNLLPMIAELTKRQLSQQPITLLARLFHDSIAAAVMFFADKLCREYDLDRIVLSGGCFQNRLLLESCLNRPETVAKIYYHHQAPTNDGGLALGQAIIAANQKQQFNTNGS